MSISKPRLTPRAEAILQYILFTILVVATPFIVVTRFLQKAFRIISHLSFRAGGTDIPYVVALGVVALLCLVVWQRRNITLRRIAAAGFVTGMILLGHRVMDIYLDPSFYDIQQNWHYAAYGVYVFYFFRAFVAPSAARVQSSPSPPGRSAVAGGYGGPRMGRGEGGDRSSVPVTSAMILTCFLSAIAMSLFDEIFQFFMSDRVFDLSDIAKDAWGAVMGMIVILFVTETYGRVDFKWTSAVQNRWRGYFRNPLSTLLLVLTFCLAYVLVTPLLSEHKYWHLALLSGLVLFLVLLLCIHFLQHRTFRIRLAGVAGVVAISLIVSYALNRDRQITYSRGMLTVYKGVPIGFFDFLVHPDGRFTVVDKKDRITLADQEYFDKRRPDILLIGSGTPGDRRADSDTFFRFNRFTGRCTQVIVLPTPDACRKFNALKAQGKSVLFVAHHSVGA